MILKQGDKERNVGAGTDLILWELIGWWLIKAKINVCLAIWRLFHIFQQKTLEYSECGLSNVSNIKEILCYFHNVVTLFSPDHMSMVLTYSTSSHIVVLL